MSLKSEVKILLKTADQFTLWKARVRVACWAATKKNVFELKQEEFKVEEDWVAKAWNILTSSLDDELFLKLKHVAQGNIIKLLSEIESALMVNAGGSAESLKYEMYGATMINTGNDLTSFVSFLKHRNEKLAFMNSALPEKEMIHLFVRGLHPVFQPFQVVFGLTGTPTKFDDVVEAVRKFASTPAMHAELAKLKATQQPQNIFNATPNKEIGVCFKFATGKCNFRGSM